eukprot:1633512-Rhodomonas_salina.2
MPEAAARARTSAKASGRDTPVRRWAVQNGLSPVLRVRVTAVNHRDSARRTGILRVRVTASGPAGWSSFNLKLTQPGPGRLSPSAARHKGHGFARGPGTDRAKLPA